MNLNTFSSRKARESGFSLIELLLVLVIIGVLGAIAIPAYLGQRRRARVIGDAQANAASIRMMMEQYKADIGVYGPAGGSLTWTFTSGTPHYLAPTLGGYATNPIPAFAPAGTSGISFNLAVGATGLTYILTATDPNLPTTIPGQIAYQTDQAGQELKRAY